MDFCLFLAEDELIEIVPSFTHDKVLNLMNGDFGPFKPAIPTQVPLWMAMSLVKQQKCKINLPDWVLELEKLTEDQAANHDALIKMPCNHWREVLKILQNHEVPLPSDGAALIELRDNILKKSLNELLDKVIDLDEDRIAQVKIRNITNFELTLFKKTITDNLATSKEIQ